MRNLNYLNLSKFAAGLLPTLPGQVPTTRPGLFGNQSMPGRPGLPGLVGRPAGPSTNQKPEETQPAGKPPMSMQPNINPLSTTPGAGSPTGKPMGPSTISKQAAGSMPDFSGPAFGQNLGGPNNLLRHPNITPPSPAPNQPTNLEQIKGYLGRLGNEAPGYAAGVLGPAAVGAGLGGVAGGGRELGFGAMTGAGAGAGALAGAGLSNLLGVHGGIPTAIGAGLGGVGAGLAANKIFYGSPQKPKKEPIPTVHPNYWSNLKNFDTDKHDEDLMKHVYEGQEMPKQHWFPPFRNKQSNEMMGYSNIGMGNGTLNPSGTGMNMPVIPTVGTASQTMPMSSLGKIAEVSKVSQFCAGFLKSCYDKKLSKQATLQAIQKSLFHSPGLTAEWRRVFSKQASFGIGTQLPNVPKVTGPASPGGFLGATAGNVAGGLFPGAKGMAQTLSKVPGAATNHINNQASNLPSAAPPPTTPPPLTNTSGQPINQPQTSPTPANSPAEANTSGPPTTYYGQGSDAGSAKGMNQTPDKPLPFTGGAKQGPGPTPGDLTRGQPGAQDNGIFSSLANRWGSMSDTEKMLLLGGGAAGIGGLVSGNPLLGVGGLLAAGSGLTGKAPWDVQGYFGGLMDPSSWGKGQAGQGGPPTPGGMPNPANTPKMPANVAISNLRQKMPELRQQLTSSPAQGLQQIQQMTKGMDPASMVQLGKELTPQDWDLLRQAAKSVAGNPIYSMMGGSKAPEQIEAMYKAVNAGTGSVAPPPAGP